MWQSSSTEYNAKLWGEIKGHGQTMTYLGVNRHRGKGGAGL